MVIQARPVPVGPTRGDFCVKRKMSLGPVSSRRGRCTSHPAEVYLGGVWSGSRALWAKLMSTTSTTSPVRISNWPLPSHFFSAKMEKSTEISSRGKKKRGCPSNFYWTGRTGCRHRFGLFSLCRDPCHMLSRLLWVGPVTDPPLLLFQPPFKKFLLEERNFFKGD